MTDGGGGRSPGPDSELRLAVSRAVAAIPRGSVVSYGEVAVRAGYPGAARAAGRVLATSRGLPWWRVVRSDGRLAAGDVREQAARLRAEGVAVEGGRIADPALRRRLPPDFTAEDMPGEPRRRRSGSGPV